MSIVLDKKDFIDIPAWRQLGLLFDSSNHSQIISDPRVRNWKDPFIYSFAFSKALNKYNPIKGGGYLTTVSLTYATNAGSVACFTPSNGPTGTVTTTSSASSITINTALPAAVLANQLANRGDDSGYYVRIIGNSAGGSGKTEVRQIVANTAGTQPTITFKTPFSFVPATGDTYEFLSGKIYMLSSGTVAFRSYDILTGAVTALATTNLPATIANGSYITVLDEQINPMSKNEGEGIFGILTATNSGATSLTGQTATGDFNVEQNEYRNFQIRIVEDTAKPTAVGQRRTIVSHTAGANPAYTVTAWSVTPSTTAKYVIESINLLICKTTSGTTNYAYAPQAITGGLNSGTGQTVNTWSTTNIASGGATAGAATVNTGTMIGSALELDMTKAREVKHSEIFEVTPSTINIYILNIAGAAAGSWSTIAHNMASTISSTAGSAIADYASNSIYGEGGKIYFTSGQYNYSFCIFSRQWNTLLRIPYTIATTATGNRRACMVYYFDVDDNKCVPFFTIGSNGANALGELVLYQLPLL